MAVYVLDKRGKPLMPCSEKRARLLLERGRARVHRLVPFVIRLIDRERESCELQPLRLKIDPGSKGTGLALVRDQETVCTDTGDLKRTAVALPRTTVQQPHSTERLACSFTATPRRYHHGLGQAAATLDTTNRTVMRVGAL